jgi:cell division protein FtsX
MNQIIIGIVLIVVGLVAAFLLFYLVYHKSYNSDFIEFLLDFWEILGIAIVVILLGIVFVIQGH